MSRTSRHFFLNAQKVLKAAVKAVLEPPVVCEFRSCTNLYSAPILMNVIECHSLKLQASPHQDRVALFDKDPSSATLSPAAMA